MGNLLLFVFSHVGVKKTESFQRIPSAIFVALSKIGEEESKSVQGNFHKSTAYKNKEFINFFLELQIKRQVNALVLGPSGTLKDYADFYRVQSLVTDILQIRTPTR